MTAQRRVVRVLGDERGYATVVSLGIILALVSLAGVILVAAGMMVATHRAQMAADLSAVAGAWAHSQGQDGCSTARQAAGLNDAVLRDCQVQGGDVMVAAVVDGQAARARAGPL